MPATEQVVFHNRSAEPVTVYINRSGTDIRIGRVDAGTTRILRLPHGIVPAFAMDLRLVAVVGCPTMRLAEHGRCMVVSQPIERDQLFATPWTFTGQRLMADPGRHLPNM